MSESKPNTAAGTDWTGLLADPDLARNLGKLLQTYRDAPPERREEALLAAMREIKQGASRSALKQGSNGTSGAAHAHARLGYSSVRARYLQPELGARPETASQDQVFCGGGAARQRWRCSYLGQSLQH